MGILSTSSDDRARLAGVAAQRKLVVATLCAAWCTTCNEFRAVLARVAEARPHITFVWVDIEDEAALCGELEVENFPTLLAFRGADVLHFGTSLPIAEVVGRVVDTIAARGAPLAAPPSCVTDLCRALAAPVTVE